jgi:hypothetical protein
MLMLVAPVTVHVRVADPPAVMVGADVVKLATNGASAVEVEEEELLPPHPIIASIRMPAHSAHKRAAKCWLNRI